MAKAHLNSEGFPIKRWLSFDASEAGLTRQSTYSWPQPCVYALYRQGQLIYIGCSTNVHGRLAVHRRTFQYDAFKVKFLMGRYGYKWLECQLIKRLRPVGNKAILARPF